MTSHFLRLKTIYWVMYQYNFIFTLVQSFASICPIFTDERCVVLMIWLKMQNMIILILRLLLVIIHRSYELGISHV